MNTVSGIRALFIFEILGKPPEYIKESLELFVKKLGEQKGIEICNKKIHEPKPIKEKDEVETENLFTTFAEVELIANNLNLIFKIVLNMLPSSVEIIEPNELRLKNFDLSEVLSELAIKLHKYDEVAKALMLERDNLINKIREMREKIEVLEKENLKKLKSKNKKIFKKNSKKKTK